MRLIDADALHIDFDRYAEYIRRLKKGRIPKTEIAILLDCKGAIDNAPTVDAVPVIRCKDCKYYRWEIDMCDEQHSTAHNIVHENDYCSRAEREEE